MNPYVVLLEEATGNFAEVTLGQGGTIVDLVVNSFTGMAEGFITVLKTGFDALILNEGGTGLSTVAIWSLVCMGLALAPKIVRWVISLFNRAAQATEDMKV